MIADILDEMTRDGFLDHDSGSAGDELLRRVRNLAERGDTNASLQIMRWEHEGARRTWNDHTKAAKATFLDSNGKLLSVPRRVGVPLRAKGVRTGKYNRRLLVEVTWDDLELVLAESVRLGSKVAERIAVISGILALRSKFPAAATPREAIILNGGDPDSLDEAMAI